MRVVIVARNKSLVASLEGRGMEVEWTDRPDRAAAMIAAQRCDIALIEAALPRFDGFALVNALRQAHVHVPLLLLTEGNRSEELLRGLRCGADDCVVSPVDLEELEERMRALHRRAKIFNANRGVVEIGGLRLDPGKREARVGERSLDLRPKELAVLQLLCERRARLVTKREIIEQVWGYRFETGTNILEVAVSRLRMKLREAGAPFEIRSVYGKGYRLEASPEKA